jgi:hypothetical protein
MRIGQSGQEPCTLSDSQITSDVASDASYDADSAQRMDIDAPHTRTPGTPGERETDPTIDNPTTSSSAIDTDRAKKVPEPRSKVLDQPTPAPARCSARLAEKRGGIHTIDDQPSVHTIYAMDPVDASPRRDHARWRLACHEELTKMDQYGTWTIVCRPKDINGVDTKWISGHGARFQGCLAVTLCPSPRCPHRLSVAITWPSPSPRCRAVALPSPRRLLYLPIIGPSDYDLLCGAAPPWRRNFVWRRKRHHLCDNRRSGV